MFNSTLFNPRLTLSVTHHPKCLPEPLTLHPRITGSPFISHRGDLANKPYINKLANQNKLAATEPFINCQNTLPCYPVDVILFHEHFLCQEIDDKLILAIGNIKSYFNYYSGDIKWNPKPLRMLWMQTFFDLHPNI